MIRACYPVHRRGGQITWSGSAFHGVSAIDVAEYAQAASERALAKGTLSSKKTDVPGIIWLETEQDVLFRNTATKVTAVMAENMRLARGATSAAQEATYGA